HPWQNEQQAKIRSIAIERIVDLIRNLNPELTTPIVLLGDFNASSGEKKPIFNDHLVKLKEAGLVDTADVAKKDTSDVPKAHSLHKMSAKVDGKDTAKVVKRGNLHIDYLWVPRGTQVKTWETLSGPGIKWKKIKGEKVPTWTGIIPSDHSPIIARLSFKQPK
ncbi:MAG: hypothetical protein LBU38_07855, partial [Propionibacteriaceae bacterium]|nr:hypothetical protein [Propionibacteriaceae bacterium]